MDKEKLDSISISSLYKRRKTDRDIFQELMPSKVKEVLLFATLYDAYTIEREGQFSDKIFGEYLQLNLYAAPRFTSVNTMEDVLPTINLRHFDLIIIMAGVDKEMPIRVAEMIHHAKPRIPILLLVNNNNDVGYFKRAASLVPAIDRVFVWNGNSNVFLAMIKYIEDKRNVARDTVLGGVRIVLLVEDSIKYYSRYLPLLFSSVLTQTQSLVSDDSTDELHKIFKYRARPKVLLVSTYEEAVQIINDYQNYLLCVISDVKFAKSGVDDEDAGIELLKYTKKMLKYPIPLLLQSHDIENARRADAIGAGFITKNSDTLAHDIHEFINTKLGFGDFIFKDKKGNKIACARNLHEFEELVSKVPMESLLYHARANGFSTWLMARGEINMAERLIPFKVEDFENTEKLRHFILNVFLDVREKKNRGRIVNFDSSLITGNRYIVRMGLGSLGGKGRGLAFMSNFLENIDMKAILKGINIRMPATTIIGAIEFDRFLELNDLLDIAFHSTDEEEIKTAFLAGDFSLSLKERLMSYITHMHQPLAVRSSGLFEDSLLQPFSGVYDTYLIPNNHPDPEVRFVQLQNAIKLIYASVFSNDARSYFQAINYKIEEEKMAIIIQPVVGKEHEGKFYVDISGIAQSFNYYPYAYMQPEDGFAVTAIGLGQAVSGGEKAYRFCPKYPGLNVGSIADQVRDTQREYWAIDLSNPELDMTHLGELAAIRKYPVSTAEKNGVIDQGLSTYDMENAVLLPGTGMRGPRVVDFANILKYNQVPLADALSVLMKLFQQAMGSPVEMEFAVDLNRGENGWPTFYLLQLKPLIRREEDVAIDLEGLERKNMVLLSRKGMGNGRIHGIRDMVYVDLDAFDRTRTREIATEVQEFNKLLSEADCKYVLIGPGRWGTRDEFTGIPVRWSYINNARVIVEVGLPDFPLDASLGSHFFHNVTSMNVGYFSVPLVDGNEFVNMDLIKSQEVIQAGKFVKWIRFPQPIEVLMDGRKRTAVVLMNHA
ncbi:MAG: pyruvate, phosphate dikinase [Marinilabiliales bacterium]|nr:pyruvate, phosphate dikinase [Marinilabiliales bacterium]